MNAEVTMKAAAMNCIESARNRLENLNFEEPGIEEIAGLLAQQVAVLRQAIELVLEYGIDEPALSEHLEQIEEATR